MTATEPTKTKTVTLTTDMRIDGDVRAKRANRGEAIVHAPTRYHASNDNLGDVLLDLLHYAAERGEPFNVHLRWARQAFLEDTGGERSSPVKAATVDLFLDALEAGGMALGK